MPKIRLLLAEDDRDHQRLLLLSLASGRPSVDVCIASSRDEVLAALRRERFECVILDFNLPPFDAPSILDDAKPLLRDTPVVVVSANDQQSVVIQSLRTGVADFVPKHEALKGQTLWTRIEQAIAQGRRQRIERRRSQRRLCALQQAAEHDYLTGLANRRYAERILSSPRRRDDRRCSTGCIMLDLDHFKRINDRHGHATGDAALQAVAKLLGAAAGPDDNVMRWGGEEFLILKASATPAQTWAWSHRLRRMLEETDHGVAAPIKLAASIGVACVPTALLSEEAVRHSDRALYLAKLLGRNRVCSSDMVRAHDAACAAAKQGGSWRERRRAMLVAFGQCGPTQREHLGAHSRLVCEMAIRVGRSLRLGRQALEHLALAAIFHDVGKLALPEELLAKPGPLCPEEKEFLTSHCVFGGDLCRALALPEVVVRAVAAHHAASGAAAGATAPAGQMGLVAILSAADAFAAMIAGRPYAPPRSCPQALAELRHHRGSRFAPDVVDTMHFIRQGEPARTPALAPCA